MRRWILRASAAVVLGIALSATSFADQPTTPPVPAAPVPAAQPLPPGAPLPHYDPYRAASPYNPIRIDRPVPDPLLNRPNMTLCCDIPNQNLGPYVGTAGCGSGFSPVQGVVTLVGNPLEKATVSLVSEDGKTTFSGVTDTSGTFTIASGEQPGAPSGTYKVIITKFKSALDGEGMNPTDPGYMKAMEKQGKELSKNSNVKAQMAGKKGPGAMMAVMAPGKGNVTPAAKMEVPMVYTSFSSTTLSVKVPLDSSPVKFDLSGGKK